MSLRNRSSSAVAKRKKSLKEWALRIGLVVGTLVVFFLLAEVATRLFSDIGPSLKLSDPVTGEHYRPGFEGEVFVAEADRKVRVRFHRDGFRGPERPREKPAGVRRVALIGDSFVAAINVDEQDTAAAQLERLLNESHPGERWEVLNFGVSAASTGTELALWRGLVHAYQPDVVLLGFFAGNDLSDNSSELGTRPRIYFELDEAGEPRQMPFFGVQKASSNWLNRHSRFYAWQKTAISGLIDKARDKVEYMAPAVYTYCAEPPPEIERAWALTEALLKTFRLEVEAAGSRFAIVLLPAAEQVYEDSLAVYQEQMGDKCDLAGSVPDQRIEGISDKHGIPLLTLRRAFRAASPAHSNRVQDEWLFHSGAGHFNERGNRLAAEQMHRFLTEAGMTASRDRALERP